MVKNLAIGLLACALVLGVAVPTYAVEDSSASTSSNDQNSSSRSASRETKLRTLEKRTEDRQEVRATKKRELQQRVETMKNKRAEKLEGARKQKCENREDRINGLLARSVTNAERRLAFFNKASERLTTFYDNRQLTSDQYEAALQAVIANEAAVTAALEVMADLRFSCDEADDEKPGQVIKEVVQARNQAMKTYKQSVRDLLQVVREALQNRDKSATDTQEEV